MKVLSLINKKRKISVLKIYKKNPKKYGLNKKVIKNLLNFEAKEIFIKEDKNTQITTVSLKKLKKQFQKRSKKYDV